MIKNISSILSRIEGMSHKEMNLYENFEDAFILANPTDMRTGDFDLLKSMLNDLCKNKIADAVLYSRLSQRLLVVADDMDDETEEQVIKDMEYISETLLEHSKEEFEFFNDILSIAMQLNLACGMDFNTLPPAASMKFQNVNEMVNFVQTRELQSIFKFYMLWQAIVATPILQDLDDEAYVYFVSLIKDIIEKELEHFNDLKSFSDVGEDEFTQSKLSVVQKHVEKDI